MKPCADASERRDRFKCFVHIHEVRFLHRHSLHRGTSQNWLGRLPGLQSEILLMNIVFHMIPVEIISTTKCSNCHGIKVWGLHTQKRETETYTANCHKAHVIYGEAAQQLQVSVTIRVQTGEAGKTWTSWEKCFNNHMQGAGSANEIIKITTWKHVDTASEMLESYISITN